MWDLWWTKWHWGRFFSKYFGFPCQFSFHRPLYTHQHLSSGAGTIGQIAADVPSGLKSDPSPKTLKKVGALSSFENYLKYSCINAEFWQGIIIIIVIIIGKTALFEPWTSFENSATLHPVFTFLDLVTLFFTERGRHPIVQLQPGGPGSCI
jgi:hypothetical protein